MTGADFNDPNLAKVVETLTARELDNLPFGAIRLDRDGRVAVYSEAEARLSGFGPRPRLGLDFFSQIAPCMGTDAFRGRAEKALTSGSLDLEFSHFGDFDDPDRELTVKIQSATGGGVWIFMRRESA